MFEVGDDLYLTVPGSTQYCQRPAYLQGRHEIARAKSDAIVAVASAFFSLLRLQFHVEEFHDARLAAQSQQRLAHHMGADKRKEIEVLAGFEERFG